MKIIFFGSSQFAVPMLEALSNKEEIVLVVTQPDRKKGRALRLSTTPIKGKTLSLGLKLFQPDDVNSNNSIEYLSRFKADIFVVVSFGKLLSKELIALPRLYPLNVHASLLPKYRGAAPINWAIANGDKETGATVIRMNERIDEGDIILKKAVTIADTDNAVTLSEKLSNEGTMLLLHSIDLIKREKVRLLKQNNSEADYAPKLEKKHGLIDWGMSSVDICNRIRAFMPWPGCFTYWKDRMLKICGAISLEKEVPQDIRPGTVIEVTNNGIFVAAGKGVLGINELHLEGSRCMGTGEFIAGHRDMAQGEVFSCEKKIL